MSGVVTWSEGMSLETLERMVILKAFKIYRENKTVTARALGIAIRTLENKLERYEAEGKSGREKVDYDEQSRQEMLERHRRGRLSQNGQEAFQASANARQNASSGSIKSAAKAPEKPSVSMSKRVKIQEVLPKESLPDGEHGSSATA